MKETKIILNKAQIRKILPHRYPFVFIDAIIELEPGERVVAIKNLKANDWIFKGHFPNHPIMPGVLIIEAIAQASIVLYHSKYKDRIKKDTEFYLGSVKTDFKSPIFPPAQLRIEVYPEKLLPAVGFAVGKVYVDNKEVATGELVFAAKL